MGAPRRMRTKLLQSGCRAFRVCSVTLELDSATQVEVPVSSDLFSQLAGGTFEVAHTAALRSFVRLGDTAIDVGANVGLFSIELARLVGPTGRVFAVEPGPEAYAFLKRNLSRNGMAHAQAMNIALSDRVERGQLQVPNGKPEYASLAPVVHESVRGTAVSAAAVVLDTIDRLFLPHLQACRLIKIDTEGHELSIIRGARSFLERLRPIISLEIEPRLLASHGASSESVLLELRSLGYSVRDLSGQALDERRLGTSGYHQFVAEP
jgi:FkbM family methyltransferase